VCAYDSYVSLPAAPLLVGKVISTSLKEYGEYGRAMRFLGLFQPTLYAPRLQCEKTFDVVLAPQQAQDEIDIELIVVKKIIERQEGVLHLEHRRDRRKDPSHEQGRPRLRRVQVVFLKGDAVLHKRLLRTLQLGHTGSVYTFTVCFVSDVIRVAFRLTGIKTFCAERPAFGLRAPRCVEAIRPRQVRTTTLVVLIRSIRACCRRGTALNRCPIPTPTTPSALPARFLGRQHFHKVEAKSIAVPGPWLVMMYPAALHALLLRAARPGFRALDNTSPSPLP